MSNKTYGQICPVARSLDILGDRWTMLVIRELLLGPKRFKDLLAILPAMGANRLSERLSMLVEKGVVQHAEILASPATQAYELTELGERLRKPVISLGFWGLDLPIDPRIDKSSARAELIALCLTGTDAARANRDVREVYEFQVGAEIFHVRVNDGFLLVRSGPGGEAVDVAIHCDIETFIALALGEISPSRALRERSVTLLRGNALALTRVFKILKYTR